MASALLKTALPAAVAVSRKTKDSTAPYFKRDKITMKLNQVLAGLLAASLFVPCAFANSTDLQSAGNPGATERKSKQTANLTRTDAQKTETQRVYLPQAGFGVLSPAVPGGGGRNNLPDTRLDSFVLNSGGRGELVFGGEGDSGPPPFSGYGMEHRIGPGLNPGLSTGHGSLMPSSQGWEGEANYSGGFTGGRAVDSGPIQYINSTLRGDMEGAPGRLGGEEEANQGFPNQTPENGSYDRERTPFNPLPGGGSGF